MFFTSYIFRNFFSSLSISRSFFNHKPMANRFLREKSWIWNFSSGMVKNRHAENNRFLFGFHPFYGFGIFLSTILASLELKVIIMRNQWCQNYGNIGVLMIPTFGSHDAQMMLKKTYQNQASKETNDAKTKTVLVYDDAYFWISRCKMMQKKLTKIRQHEWQKMSKAIHLSSLMMPNFRHENA